MNTWADIFLGIDPYSYAYLGIAMAIGLSIFGAAWYVYTLYVVCCMLHAKRCMIREMRCAMCDV